MPGGACWSWKNGSVVVWAFISWVQNHKHSNDKKKARCHMVADICNPCDRQTGMGGSSGFASWLIQQSSLFKKLRIHRTLSQKISVEHLGKKQNVKHWPPHSYTHSRMYTHTLTPPSSPPLQTTTTTTKLTRIKEIYFLSEWQKKIELCTAQNFSCAVAKFSDQSILMEKRFMVAPSSKA